MTTTSTRPTGAQARHAPAPTPAAAGAEGDERAFVRWGLASYGVSTLVVVGSVVARLGGHLGYVLDDPAIHLSVADHLVHDGTWGVAAGHFQSASSSPLWTALLAAALAVAPPARDAVPVLLNVVAGIGVLYVLARPAAAGGLRPGRGRPLEAAAVVVLVVTVLFLPGLAIVAMEHTLHMALVLAALAAVHRTAADGPTRRRDRLGYALVVLATLARFETAFVALGLALGLLAVDPRRHARRAAKVLAASALTVAAFAAFNRAMGGGWLPNSILAKGQGTGHAGDEGLGPVDVVDRLTLDPLVALLFAVATGYVIVRWRRGDALVPAVTVAVAIVGHAALADVGWFERYQAYLIGLGAYLALTILAEVPATLRARAVAAFGLLAVIVTATKAGHLVHAARGADDIYRHQYQAARFLERYYDGQPIATDQLGYISLFHDGPLTDLAGLGDYDVLQAPESPGDLEATWSRLARQRRFRVVVLYDVSAAYNAPDTWVSAGQLTFSDHTISGVSDTLRFYATTPDEVAPLQEHLRAFEPELPPRVELKMNGYARLQAARIRERLEAEAPSDPAGGPGGPTGEAGT